MKRNLVYSAAIILMVINVAALATLLYNRWTGSQTPSTFAQRDQRFDHMKQELALSPEQVAQLGVYRTSFHAEIDSLTGLLVSARIALARALLQGEVDTAQVTSTFQEINRLQAAAQTRVMAHLLDVKGILNRAQQERFTAIVLERFSSEADRPLSGRPSH